MDPLAIAASVAYDVFGRDFNWKHLPSHIAPNTSGGAGIDIEFMVDEHDGPVYWSANVLYRAGGVARQAVTV